MPKSNLQHEAARLRAAAQGGARVWFMPHANKAMKDDNLYRDDVETMLGACMVSQIEESGDEETLRAEGVDFDGRPIVAIVVLYDDPPPPEIKVITSWVKK